MSRIDITRLASAFLAAVVLSACSPADTPKAPDSGDGVAAAAAAHMDVPLTGRIIEVGMSTDAEGNYFRPNHIEAHRGDIVRFALRSGVHNVHFLADSNPGRTGLPGISDFLQLPGQEFDVVVAMAPGDYYFQCDPHALLGMVGRLEVEDEDN